MTSLEKSGAGLIPVFIVALVVVFWKDGGISGHGWGDILMFAAFVALMIWLLLPRRSDKSSRQDSTPE